MYNSLHDRDARLHTISKLILSGTFDFDEIALELFYIQSQHVHVYKKYIEYLGVDATSINNTKDIPFMPVSLFKSGEIIINGLKPERVFSSSSTGGQGQSLHPVYNFSLYRDYCLHIFNKFYGPVENYCILGLLPSYLEREGSSLVYMVEELAKKSGHILSGFYLYDFEKLYDILVELESAGQKTILIGVTFALLDFASSFPLTLKHTIVMETGGMKGKRAERTRAEIHETLKEQLGIRSVHSEYGMTELLSQAYSSGQGVFELPQTMKILIREISDPFAWCMEGAWGAINIIDLANIYSCSFLATDDIGKVHPENRFEVAGRLDYSDVRGCSLLYV